MKSNTPIAMLAPQRNPSPKGSARLLIAALLLLGLLCAAAEGIYRLCWFGKCQFFSPQDKGEFFELYIVGESTALGAPYHFVGSPFLPAAIERQFNGSINGRNMRLFSLAKSGETVYPQAVGFEHALRCRDERNPGAVLIYASHNDATKRRGIPLSERGRNFIRRHSRLLGDLLYVLERKRLLPSARTLDTYQYHMERIVELSLKSGLTPIPATGVSNRVDIDPFVGEETGFSFDEIGQILDQGISLEQAGRYHEAIRYYRVQMQEHPTMSPYLKYRMAKANHAAGQLKDAKVLYEEAAEETPEDNFGRAKKLQNEFIMGLGSRYGIPVVDAVKIFRENSSDGFVGDNLFIDGHHPNMQGYILLANGFANKLSEHFHEPVKRRLLDPEAVFKEFPYGQQRNIAAYVNSGEWLFSASARHAYPRQRLLKAKARLESALVLRPDDFAALVNLGMTEVALRGNLLSTWNGIAWFQEYFVFYRDVLPEDRPGKEWLKQIIAKLKGCGVDNDLIARIIQAYNRKYEMIQ